MLIVVCLIIVIFNVIICLLLLVLGSIEFYCLSSFCVLFTLSCWKPVLVLILHWRKSSFVCSFVRLLHICLWWNRRACNLLEPKRKINVVACCVIIMFYADSVRACFNPCVDSYRECCKWSHRVSSQPLTSQYQPKQWLYRWFNTRKECRSIHRLREKFWRNQLERCERSLRSGDNIIVVRRDSANNKRQSLQQLVISTITCKVLIYVIISGVAIHVTLQGTFPRLFFSAIFRTSLNVFVSIATFLE